MSIFYVIRVCTDLASRFLLSANLIVILAGYPLTQFTIRPFAEYDLTNNRGEARARRDWNFALSHLRIAIEHAFGRLKGRFPILRNFPGQEFKPIFETIEACMIIHNVLTRLGDDPDEIEGYNGLEDTTDENDIVENILEGDNRPGGLRGMDESTLYRTGLYRRKQLLDLMLQN